MGSHCLFILFIFLPGMASSTWKAGRIKRAVKRDALPSTPGPRLSGRDSCFPRFIVIGFTTQNDFRKRNMSSVDLFESQETPVEPEPEKSKVAEEVSEGDVVVDKNTEHQSEEGAEVGT